VSASRGLTSPQSAGGSARAWSRSWRPSRADSLAHGQGGGLVSFGSPSLLPSTSRSRHRASTVSTWAARCRR
jgi:hypothetical protein